MKRYRSHFQHLVVHSITYWFVVVVIHVIHRHRPSSSCLVIVHYHRQSSQSIIRIKNDNGLQLAVKRYRSQNTNYENYNRWCVMVRTHNKPTIYVGFWLWEINMYAFFTIGFLWWHVTSTKVPNGTEKQKRQSSSSKCRNYKCDLKIPNGTLILFLP